VLDIASSSTQKQVKLAYYKMAKKYHPDFQFDQSEKAKSEAEFHFKKIQKAYEVLSNPISRQAYDIDNQLNTGQTVDSKTYEDSTSKSNYVFVRQQTDFYHTKWSNYEKPDWYHPYNGRDFRSEYLYTRRSDDLAMALPPHVLIAVDFFDRYRPYIYLVLFGFSQLYAAYKYWLAKRVEKQEMEVLQSSFALEGQGDATASLLSMAASFSEEGEDGDVIEMSPEAAEAIKTQMEMYIKERQSLYSDALDAKVLQE